MTLVLLYCPRNSFGGFSKIQHVSVLHVLYVEDNFRRENSPWGFFTQKQ